jgi:DNA (cytosine-5)-methyltransferase 1
MGKMDFPDRTDRLCRTIMATESYCSRESIIFPKGDSYRAPTIRELACLMGFPIDYQFIGTNSNSKHKQIGNAVCVHVSMALAKAIKQELQVTLKKRPRVLVKTPNLNDLKEPLYVHYKSGPKKLNSKFHVHVPYLKIKQLVHF